MIERWRSRLRTAEAIVGLCTAQLLVASMAFKRWRPTLGGSFNSGKAPVRAEAVQIAAHVEWAVKLLPFTTKCLPRAMALSWSLRLRRIRHCVVFAVRPAEQRGADDQLHAWVEVSGEKILGDLPGPWVVTLRIGDSKDGTN